MTKALCVGGCADGVWVDDQKRPRQVVYVPIHHPGVCRYGPAGLEVIEQTIVETCIGEYRRSEFRTTYDPLRPGTVLYIAEGADDYDAIAMLAAGYKPDKKDAT